MELKVYLRVLASKWWVIAFTFLVTYGATLWLTFTEVPLYESSATFVVTLSPTSRSDKDLASAVDILSRRTEIGTTFSQVAGSRAIKRQAIEELGLTGEQQSSIAVTSQLVPGTNVLRITTTANSPLVARNFTNAVGAKTVAYVRDLYETYNLEPLDPANMPNTPASPNKPFNLILGAVIGLVLGSGLAFLSAYLQSPAEPVASFGLLEDQTGMYSRRYFELRLRQELSRAKRSGLPVSIALVNIDPAKAVDALAPAVQAEALRSVNKLLLPELREEDILAQWRPTVLAVLFPDTPEHVAAVRLEALQARLTASPITLARTGRQMTLQAALGLATANDTSLSFDELIAQAERALSEAEHAVSGTIYPFLLSRALPKPSIAGVAKE